MGKFFTPNISGWGRVVRAIWGLLCIGGGVALSSRTRIGFLVLVAAGVFALFEAVRGWCVMRACGVKTKF